LKLHISKLQNCLKKEPCWQLNTRICRHYGTLYKHKANILVSLVVLSSSLIRKLLFWTLIQST